MIQVAWCDRGDSFGQLKRRLIRELRRKDVSERLGLLRHRFGDAPAAVTQDDVCRPRAAIDVALARLIIKINALTPDDNGIMVGRIAMEKC